MKLNPKPIRIKPAFEDREQIRAMLSGMLRIERSQPTLPRGSKMRAVKTPSGQFLRGSGETGPWPGSRLLRVPN